MSGTSSWLRHPTWRAVQRYWRAELARRPLHCEATRCLHPGRPIERRAHTPLSLDVGHVVARAEAVRLGWTIEQTNALSNTRPEHAQCGRTDGARVGGLTVAARRRASAHDPGPSGVW